MIEITEEQEREIEKSDSVKLCNPRTDETYVLMRADLFERMRAVIDSVSKRAGWDDPTLDAYEQYRKAK